MANADRIRNRIIDKLLTINNETYLTSLFQVVENSIKNWNRDESARKTYPAPQQPPAHRPPKHRAGHNNQCGRKYQVISGKHDGGKNLKY